jgi:hypothetical protein
MPFQGSHCAIWGVDDPQHLSGFATIRPSDRRRQRRNQKAPRQFPSWYDDTPRNGPVRAGRLKASMTTRGTERRPSGQVRGTPT